MLNFAADISRFFWVFLNLLLFLSFFLPSFRGTKKTKNSNEMDDGWDSLCLEQFVG